MIICLRFIKNCQQTTAERSKSRRLDQKSKTVPVILEYHEKIVPVKPVELIVKKEAKRIVPKVDADSKRRPEILHPEMKKLVMRVMGGIQSGFGGHGAVAGLPFSTVTKLRQDARDYESISAQILEKMFPGAPLEKQTEKAKGRFYARVEKEFIKGHALIDPFAAPDRFGHGTSVQDVVKEFLKEFRLVVQGPAESVNERVSKAIWTADE